MPEPTIAKQRCRVLAAFALLLLAVVLQPAYFIARSYFETFARLFAFVPALSFVLVILSAALAVWVEQTAENDLIKRCARQQIWIFVILAILGILSAAQASASLGIQNPWLLGLLNLSAVAAIIASLAVGGVLFVRAIGSLPKQ
jgi:hypothetical protein